MRCARCSAKLRYCTDGAGGLVECCDRCRSEGGVPLVVPDGHRFHDQRERLQAEWNKEVSPVRSASASRSGTKSRQRLPRNFNAAFRREND